ncbi:MAG: hypothetical protein ACYCUZ_05330 [Cuniculiplasma sp.]
MIGQEEETDPLMASMNYFPYFVPEYLVKKFGCVRLYYDMEFVLDMHELQECGGHLLQ